jgi:hypothetical protein
LLAGDAFRDLPRKLERLRVTQFDAGPVQPRDLALAILHGPTYLISVAAHRKFKCRVQFGMNMLACETCCPRRRNRAGAPKNRSNEPLLRAKEIAAR